jgi:hypothetical protein
MNIEHIPSAGEIQLKHLREQIRAMKAEEVNLLEIEWTIQERVNAMGRELMAEAMKRADTDAPEVEIAGEHWGNCRISNKTYQTIFGPIELPRSIYQRSGRGRVASPMELRLGIVEGTYTPRMARIVTRAIAVTTEEEAAGLLAEVGTAVVSSSTLSRIPRAMAARYENDRTAIEAALREQDVIPEQAVTIQVGIDGVMVPQDGECNKPRGRKTDHPQPPRHERQYGPVNSNGPANDDGTQGRAWHEGSVGTVAYIDAEGRRLKTTYIARMPEANKATTVAMIEEELQSVLRERPQTNVVFASDGAAAHWKAFEGMASRLPENFTGHTMPLVDAFHVAEHVQTGAEAVKGKGSSDASILSATWRETIKEKRNGAETVVRSMRAYIGGGLSQARVKELDKSINYIDEQNNAGRMEYVEAQKRHYPIGTGVTEAAAKTLVGTRMKRAGARFSQHGGQTVMLFRAALLSDRFDALHRQLQLTYTKPLRIAA